MDREQLEKMFDEEFTAGGNWIPYLEPGKEKNIMFEPEEVKDFIFQTVIPEVLKGFYDGLCWEAKDDFKKRAKELYNIDL